MTFIIRHTVHKYTTFTYSPKSHPSPGSGSSKRVAMRMCLLAVNKTEMTPRQTPGRQRDSVKTRDVINLAQSNSRNVPVCQKQIAACLPTIAGQRSAHIWSNIAHSLSRVHSEQTRTSNVRRSVERWEISACLANKSTLNEQFTLKNTILSYQTCMTLFLG